MTNGYTFFWHEYEENGYLSNWYKSDFIIDDFKYSSVEQYIMAQKAKLFHDADMYTAILKEDDPATCKKHGRNVKNFDPELWDKNTEEILLKGLYAKFSQNEALKAKLLNTGTSYMAEASPYDSKFGIGIDAATALQTSPQSWPGKNILGIA